jgi:hypothetical protein
MTVFKFMLSTALLLSVVASGAEQKHRYIFVYTVPVPMPSYIQTAILCSEPGCNNVYRDEERHEWFDSLTEALSAMNARQHPSAWTGGPNAPDSRIVGLYEVTGVPVSLVKVGTEKRQVQKYVEVEVPVMEWQVKP